MIIVQEKGLLGAYTKACVSAAIIMRSLHLLLMFMRFCDYVVLGIGAVMVALIIENCM